MPLGASLFEQVCGGGLAREKKDLSVWQFAARDNCSFDAGHSSHDDVADEHIGLEVLERLNGFFSAKNCTCLKACLIQNNCQSVGDYLFVIGDQDLGFRCSRCCWICHTDCP